MTPEDPYRSGRASTRRSGYTGVQLSVRSWGAPGDPTILLIGAPTVLSWDPEQCRRLAGAGRRLVSHDLRDAGASTVSTLVRPA